MRHCGGHKSRAVRLAAWRALAPSQREKYKGPALARTRREFEEELDREKRTRSAGEWGRSAAVYVASACSAALCTWTRVAAEPVAAAVLCSRHKGGRESFVLTGRQGDDILR